MSNNKIEVDPEVLRATAKKIDKQVEGYKKVYTSLFSEVDGLAKAWKGEDNLAYTNQVDGFRDDFEMMTAKIEEYSNFLKDSATKYENTQKDIIAGAKKLSN